MVRSTLVVLIALIAVLPAFGQEVQVFLTSDTFLANFPPTTGLQGADEECTAAAQAVGLTGNWTAWLSDSTTDARNRIIDAQYVDLNGVVIADDLADLTDGTLDNPLTLREDGVVENAGSIFTATLADGTFDANTNACLDWTVAAAESETHGEVGLTSGSWTNSGVVSGCGIVRRLYCFSAFEVPVELEKFSVE